MKFFKLGSTKLANVNIAKYSVDWDREVSKPQKKVKDFLRPYWENHVLLEEFRCPGSLVRVDLLNITLKVAIEVSPKGTHAFNPFFHKNRVKFGQMVGRELDKQEWLEQNGFKLIELDDEDLNNLSKQWILEKHGLEL